MNILMIYPKPDKFKKPRFGFSYELLLIATVAEKKHNIFIKDFSCEIFSSDNLIHFILEHSIDLVFVECDSYALKRSQNIINASEIIDILNQYIPTIAYGAYCYISKKNFFNAKYTIKDNDINKIIELLNYFDKSNAISYITEYDDLPYINRSLISQIPYYRQNNKNTLLQTAKGCENTCIFCQRKGWQHNYVTHSDNYVIDEIAMIKSNGYRNVWIIDENFTFNLIRAKRILKNIITKELHQNMYFFISSWANIDEEFLNIAKECNVKIISFGIESGNKDILQYYKKNIDIAKVSYLIRYANSIGIYTVGNFIIGAPMETDITINETFELIRNCEFDQVNIKTLDYMIGSALYDSLDECIKINDHIFACSENGLNSFKLEDIENKKKNFLLDYYKEHKSIIKNKIQKYGMPYYE